MVSKRSQEVANAFDKYIRKGDRSLIETFSNQEIERTLSEYSAGILPHIFEPVSGLI